MESKRTNQLKIRIRYEAAYEIIFSSVIIIFVGLAFLFASNLLAFNWYTVVFGIIGLSLLYLKYSSYVIFDEKNLEIIYFKFFIKETIPLSTIKEFTFYEKSWKTEVKTKRNQKYKFYLSEKNEQILLDWLVNYYPNISCIFVSEKRGND